MKFYFTILLAIGISHGFSLNPTIPQGSSVLLVCGRNRNSDSNRPSTVTLINPPTILNGVSDGEAKSIRTARILLNVRFVPQPRNDWVPTPCDFCLSASKLICTTKLPTLSVSTFSIRPTMPTSLIGKAIGELLSKPFNNSMNGVFPDIRSKSGMASLLMPMAPYPSTDLIGWFGAELLSAILLTDKSLAFASASAFVDRSYRCANCSTFVLRVKLLDCSDKTFTSFDETSFSNWMACGIALASPISSITTPSVTHEINRNSHLSWPPLPCGSLLAVPIPIFLDSLNNHHSPTQPTATKIAAITSNEIQNHGSGVSQTQIQAPKIVARSLEAVLILLLLFVTFILLIDWVKPDGFAGLSTSRKLPKKTK
jgi:hypothetical protein